MNDLFWPGDDRAGDHFTSESFLAAMVEVEQEWLGLLIQHGIAPAAADHLLAAELHHLEWLVNESELTGTPVAGLLHLLREDPGTPPETARWLHRGLTSQDVVDTAIMLLARAATAEILEDFRAQIAELTALAHTHRQTPMIGRTLTQHAVPVTFGLVVSQWLSGFLDAHDDLAALHFPVQVGGAAGTLAALVELGVTDPAVFAADLADRLQLEAAIPWHTTRTPVTRLADALVRCTDAWGRFANDVLALGRPEIGELTDASAGGSSTMPHKANPVLAILVKRAALSTPALGSALHLGAAFSVDQRSDGAWQAEWATLRDLVRRVVTAGSQTVELLGGLQVHAERMAATLSAAHSDAHAEQRTMAELAGHPPAGDYLGISTDLVDAVLRRAERVSA